MYRWNYRPHSVNYPVSRFVSVLLDKHIGITYIGHRSIVNTTLIHPNLLHVISSGVENDIILHSPTMSSPCSKNLSMTETDVRRLPDASSNEVDPDDVSTEAQVIDMFDR
jgi:hypothetical protein